MTIVIAQKNPPTMNKTKVKGKCEQKVSMHNIKISKA